MENDPENYGHLVDMDDKWLAHDDVESGGATATPHNMDTEFHAKGKGSRIA